MMIPLPLPPWHSDKAPCFDPNDPSTLEDCFTDFEILTMAAQLKEEDNMINAVCYAPSSEKDFWSSIPEYETRLADYEAYKKAIYMHYLGSSPKEKWTFWDLEHLC
jgi:hypothetical protein